MTQEQEGLKGGQHPSKLLPFHNPDAQSSVWVTPTDDFMVSHTEKFERLRVELSSRNIPMDAPGFYDHENFLAAEKIDKAFLFNYGRFVYWREYDSEYLAKAQAIVPIVAAELYRGLVEQNLQGACIVTAMIFQRILDRHGVWSTIVKGSLNAYFANGAWGIYTLDQSPANGRENGHQWIYAPPYQIVDLTLNMQGEGPSITKLLPDTVVATDVKETRNVKFDELISPEMREYFSHREISAYSAVSKYSPVYLKEIWPDFRAHTVVRDKSNLKYIVTGFGGSDGDLEKINGYCVDGQSAFEFYLTDIKPKIEALGY